MKIDYHSHILPGLDDGARDIEDAVMLAEAMHGWGFERITCTPHINALYRNTPETIFIKCAKHLELVLPGASSAPNQGIKKLLLFPTGVFEVFR